VIGLLHVLQITPVILLLYKQLDLYCLSCMRRVLWTLGYIFFILRHSI